MTKNKGFLQVGLAVLVASVLVAGFLIQKVNFDQASAALPGTCVCKKANGTDAGPGVCSGGSCDCGAYDVKSNACGVKAPDPKPEQQKSENTCTANSGVWCNGIDVNKKSYGFCKSSSDTKKCNSVAASLGYVIKTGIGSPGSYTGGSYCRVGVNNYTGGPCISTKSIDGVVYSKPPSCFCGVIQIDGGEYDGTYESSCGCNKEPTAPPVKTPSPTPVITPSPSPTPSRSPSPTPTCTPSPTPSPTPVCTPTPSPTPVPQCNSFCVSDSQCLTGSTCFWGRCRNPSCKTSNSCTCSSPTPSPSPRPSASPTSSPSPTATPIAQGKLKICKYNDLNNNGHIDDGEKTIAWYFIYKYQDSEHKVGSAWWHVFDHGCREVSVPANQWINVREEYKNEWVQTGVYQDGNWVGNSDYNYIAESNVLKNVTFLNHFEKSSTPAPTASATPNWCNGTCGSNYNCQGGLFCYNGYCRNPNCTSDTSCGCGIIATPTPTAPPVVLGATAPPVLPKTGADPLTIAVGLVGLSGTGVYLFRKFKLV